MKISMGNIKKVMHKSICYYLLFKTSFYINIIFKYLNITFASYIKCESFNTYNNVKWLIKYVIVYKMVFCNCSIIGIQ